MSPGLETEDVQDIADPQSANAESLTREAQSPLQFNEEDRGIEHLRDGGFPEYMPSPPPRSLPFRIEPSTSTYREDLPEQRSSGRSDIPEMADEELYFLEVGRNTR